MNTMAAAVVTLIVFVAVTASATLLQANSGDGITQTIDEPVFAFEGRWLKVPGGPAPGVPHIIADWPCSRIRFSVHMKWSSSGAQSATVPVFWFGERVRLNATLSNGEAQTLIGPVTVLGEKGDVTRSQLTINRANSSGNSGASDQGETITVTLTKLNSPMPFGGVGSLASDFIRPSVFRFYGVGQVTSQDGASGTVVAPPRKPRVLQTIGASDTASWCCDGTPNITKKWGGAYLALNGWRYTNCDFSYSAVLARRFDAEVSVQAEQGIGLVQNAFSNQKWQLGNESMDQYFWQTLFSDPDAGLWNFSAARRPELVLTNLGGDDFNNQVVNGTPSQGKYNEAYSKFMVKLFTTYDAMATSDSSSETDGADANTTLTTKILQTCGMGHPPTGVEPNGRCWPCPFVHAATTNFTATYPQYQDRFKYLNVPCDGSVIPAGNADLGCDGHKNRAGQKAVADFLEPRIRDWMKW